MIDIHCHILPGIDDGPETMDISRAMAEMAIEDGITHVIATPHAHPSHEFDPRIIAERRRELQSLYEGRLLLATGCDFHLSYENLRSIRFDPSLYTLNQKDYLLVEFADFSIPPSLDQALHDLQLAGLHPVITHPERNPLIRTKPERLFHWLQQGCYVQVTAQSLTGRFGPSAKQVAEEWIRAGAVHILASDAHNTTTRPLRLKETFDLVAKDYGEEKARALLIENPLAVFEGRPLPHVPEVETEFSSAGKRKKKRFWIF